MKKALLLSFALCVTLSLQAALHYTNYGSDGWHIGMNENIAVDIDNDGDNDFYVNSWNNELGFVPIYGKGCFSSPDPSATTIFGSRELTIHQAGDIMDASTNTWAFIDDGRGSTYSANTNQLADGWVDGEDQYVGFFIFGSGRFGWMKVAIDITNQKIIIKEMAYESENHGAIEIGYTGQDPNNIHTPQSNETVGTNLGNTVSNEEIEKDLQELSVFPNPTNEKVNINFDYQGVDQLSIVVVNSVGQEVFRNATNVNAGKANLEISTSTWNAGIYFIKFQSEKGIKTERLSVTK
ncbi:MAG: T9SS type A sorting domain-containing protein [Saprospiraceae bacterium]